MATILTTVEQLFQRFIERPIMRLFGGRLEPADIAKHLSQSMEDERKVFSGKLVGPNHYEVQLSTEDMALFQSYEQSLREELSDYLVDLAHRRGITLMGRPQVFLLPSPNLKRGTVQVQAQLVDRSGDGHTRQYTRPLEVLKVDPAPVAKVVEAWLELPDRTVALNQPFVTLGRSVDNDIILEGDDVSRYHAEIKRRGSHYVVTDKKSANGTRVNDKRISECVLQDGDELCLAASCMTFKMIDPYGRWGAKERG